MESIVVDGVTKRFTLRHAHSIKEMTVRAARRQSLSERFTALDDVSLTVEQGESRRPHGPERLGQVAPC